VYQKTRPEKMSRWSEKTTKSHEKCEERIEKEGEMA
jgi:hypothetical protein